MERASVVNGPQRPSRSFRFLDCQEFVPSFSFMFHSWHDLVEHEEADTKADDEGEHGLAGLAVALQRREQLVVRLRVRSGRVRRRQFYVHIRKNPRRPISQSRVPAHPCTCSTLEVALVAASKISPTWSCCSISFPVKSPSSCESSTIFPSIILGVDVLLIGLL